MTKKLGKKAAKITVRHSARGVTAKARRQPIRGVTLLGAGAAIGAVGGWLLGHRTPAPGN